MAEASHEALQTQFMAVVERMISIGCSLPDDFTLFYRIRCERDREGGVVNIHPYLTVKEAHADCGKNEKWIGKYGTEIKYTIAGPRGSIDAGKTSDTESDEETDSNGEPISKDHNVPKWTWKGKGHQVRYHVPSGTY